MNARTVLFAAVLVLAFGGACGAGGRNVSRADRLKTATSNSSVEPSSRLQLKATPREHVSTSRVAAEASRTARETNVVHAAPEAPASQRLAYASRICAWWEGCADDALHVVDLASGQDRKLGITGNVPRWSPDGGRLLYQRRRVECDAAGGPDVVCDDIFVSNADGRGERKIIQSAANPSFSPDGKRVAIDRLITVPRSGSTCTGCVGIAIADLESGETRTLTDSGSQAAFSPDGRHIAFVRGGDIWMMRSDGSAAGRVSAVPTSAQSYRPAWSPDGKTIGFTAFLCTSDCNQRPDRYHTYTVRPSGVGLTELEGVGGDSFSWSRDAKTVAVERANCWDTCPPPDTLIMSADGSQAKLLVKSAAAPAFSP